MDRATIPPSNLIEIGKAAICACDPDPQKCHVYDTGKYNGTCPGGSAQALLLGEILDNRSAPEKAAVILAADRAFDEGPLVAWAHEHPSFAALARAIKILRAKEGEREIYQLDRSDA